MGYPQINDTDILPFEKTVHTPVLAESKTVLRTTMEADHNGFILHCK